MRSTNAAGFPLPTMADPGGTGSMAPDFDEPAEDKARRTLASAPLALAMLTDMRADVANARAARSEVSDRLMDLRQEHAAVGGQLGNLTRGQDRTHLERRRDALARQIGDAQLRLNRISDGGLGRLLSRLDKWLASQRGPLADAPLPGVKFTMTNLARVRDQIAQLARDEEAVRRAPKPVAGRLARMEATVDALAAKVSFREDAGFRTVPEVTQLRHAATMAIEGHPQVPVTGMVVREAPDPIAVMAFLWRDRMVESLARQIGAAGDDRDALTDAERAARLADIAVSRLGLERTEEALVRAAEQPVERRRDASPEPILAVIAP